MRRKDREINDNSIIEEIINKCEICYLGMSDRTEPYVVPLNFGYRDKTIYIHSAPAGKKLDLLRENPNVSIAFTSDFEQQIKGKPEEWTTRYRSVIATGKAEIETDTQAKQHGINILISKYTDRNYEFSPDVLDKIVIIKIPLVIITGKGNWV